MSNTNVELVSNTQGLIVVAILILEALAFLCIGIASHNKKYKKSVERKVQEESNTCNDAPVKKATGGDSPMSDTPKTDVSDSDEVDFAMDDLDMDDSDFEVSPQTLESMNLVTRVPLCLSSISERSEEEDETSSSHQ